MKRGITLSIALVLSVVLLSLMKSDSTVTAQNQMRLVADTGVVTLGADQTLRIMAEWSRGDGVTVRFREIEYGEGTCTGGVCRHSIQSQTTSDPVMLMPGEAASIVVDPSDPTGNTYVRAMVLSNDRNAKVTALIVDNLTGEVVAIWLPGTY